jgi:hypothetical protein
VSGCVAHAGSPAFGCSDCDAASSRAALSHALAAPYEDFRATIATLTRERDEARAERDAERERCARHCEVLAHFMETGAGPLTMPGARLRQAADNIRVGKPAVLWAPEYGVDPEYTIPDANALRAEVTALRAALRTMTQHRISELPDGDARLCGVCTRTWPIDAPESHAPGCLAAEVTALRRELGVNQRGEEYRTREHTLLRAARRCVAADEDGRFDTDACTALAVAVDAYRSAPGCLAAEVGR